MALTRLSRAPDGRLSYRLKRPAPSGATHLRLAPLELLAKLATLIPPPRVNQVRYHGVFAPHSAARAHVVPRTTPDEEEASPASAGATDRDPLSPSPAPRVPATVLARRLDRAALLERVFAVDLRTCSRCGGTRRVLAFITDPDVTRRILDHLGLPSCPPPVAPARAPPQPELDVRHDDP